ncbi:MAG TPA: AI-2E family transporter [Rhizomicrobium sp.]|jgi:predicted PurR-regulated permease PerM
MLSASGRDFGGWLVAALAVLAILVFGRPLLAPFAFAVLVWAILNALVDVLERAKLPPLLAWATSLLFIAAALYLIARILGNEADAVSAQAPAYFTKLKMLAESALAFLHLGRGTRIEELFSASSIAGALGRAAASAGSFLFNLAMIIVYVGFLLAEQPWLPEKLARLQKDATRREAAAQVIRAVVRQVQAYLGVCTFLSAIMAAAAYVLLAAMHVSFAGFWALVLFLATYIPTVGAAAVLLPALMALLQFGSLAPFLIVAVVLGALHFVLANIVSTILLGRTLNLSPLGIILSLSFWGLIWGISGLFLAVPITGAFAIVCRHVGALNWIAIALAGPEHRQKQKSHLAPLRES